MYLVIQVQNLDKAICDSLYTNALGKGMNPYVVLIMGEKSKFKSLGLVWLPVKEKEN